MLAELMKGYAVTCEPRTTDRYGRAVALCQADGRDLSADMVRAGMAWAFVRHSQDYVSIENEAKDAGIGVHRRSCTPAWEWRAKQRATQ